MKLRPRLNRAPALTAIVGVIATIMALLVAGPAAATGTGGGGTSADQALAWYETSNVGKVLYTNTPGDLVIRITAAEPQGTASQLPIDAVEIPLPSEFPFYALPSTSVTASNGGKWTLSESGGVVTATANGPANGNAGLNAYSSDDSLNDYVDLPITVTPKNTGTYKVPDIVGAVHYQLDSTSGHAQHVGHWPRATVGVQVACDKSKTCDTSIDASVGDVTGHGTYTINAGRDNAPGQITASVETSGTLNCGGTNSVSGQVLTFVVTDDRTSTLTYTAAGTVDPDHAACFNKHGDPNAVPFYVLNTSGAVDTSGTTLAGWVPSCDALKAAVNGSLADYPCVESIITDGTTTSVEVYVPAGDPRFTTGL